MQATTRRKDLDLLKGISILAVVLYHMGVLESGYLGVDVFFVIAGFLTVPKIIDRIEQGTFSYVKYIWGRVMRLLPLVLIGSALCLVIGYIFWLPDDYENLAQSVIASTAFSNNILSAITTKNYWDSVNDFKPLMHTWYLGILMQFYVVFPLITLALRKVARLCKKNTKTLLLGGSVVLTALSFILFLLPNVSVGNRFYLLPFRFYELMLGGLVGLWMDKSRSWNPRVCKGIIVASFVLIIALIFIGVFTFDPANIGVEAVVIGGEETANALLLPNSVLVPLTVLFTSVFLLASTSADLFSRLRVLPGIGKRSFSIFVWHQILLALYRYSISSEITVWFVLGFLALLAGLSELSYRFIELRVTSKQSVLAVVCACCICGFSGVLYLKAGVVRDVPELGIYRSDIHRGMHAEYCDRVYGYDKDFADEDKWNVLVIGHSFARDFGNILLESQYAQEIELSYSFDFNEGIANRIEQADRIFVFGHREDVPAFLWEHVQSPEIVYGIGTKKFGPLNGQIYLKRFTEEYFAQTVELDPNYKIANDRLRDSWGDHYIDMLAVVTSENRVKVFTDTNRYISQDTTHLTQAGAQYYAKLLNLEELLYTNN